VHGRECKIANWFCGHQKLVTRSRKSRGSYLFGWCGAGGAKSLGNRKTKKMRERERKVDAYLGGPRNTKTNSSAGTRDGPFIGILISIAWDEAKRKHLCNKISQGQNVKRVSAVRLKREKIGTGSGPFRRTRAGAFGRGRKGRGCWRGEPGRSVRVVISNRGVTYINAVQEREKSYKKSVPPFGRGEEIGKL